MRSTREITIHSNILQTSDLEDFKNKSEGPQGEYQDPGLNGHSFEGTGILHLHSHDLNS
jgi:hypothetical protein